MLELVAKSEVEAARKVIRSHFAEVKGDLERRINSDGTDRLARIDMAGRALQVDECQGIVERALAKLLAM